LRKNNDFTFILPKVSGKIEGKVESVRIAGNTFGGKQMKRSVLILVLTAVFLFGFTACKKDGNIQQESRVTLPQMTLPSQTTTYVFTLPVVTTTTTEETEEEDPFSEKMTITWLTGTGSSHEYIDGRWDELELEEKFNIDLVMWKVFIDPVDTEEVQMMLAAGDVPDYGFYYADAKELYEAGMIRTIPVRLMEKYYPSYYQRLLDEPLGFDLNKADRAGEFYGFTSFSCLAYYSETVPLWRLDWLQKYNYRMYNLTPVKSWAYPQYEKNLYFSNIKFTEEDVKEIFRAFTEDDPDGNGIDDTYGSVYAGPDRNVYDFYAMFGFDSDENFFYLNKETGDYVPYFAYSGYREALKFLTQMLDRGFMRRIPENGNTEEQLNALWASGKIGFMNAFSGSSILGYHEKAAERPPLSILKSDPNATFVVTPPPGREGKLKSYRVFNWDPEHTYIVGAQVSDEKLIRLMQLLEYAYFGEDWLRYRFGLEGVHYVWAGEPYVSPMILDSPENIPPKYAGLGTSVFGQFGNIHFVPDIKAYFGYDAFTSQMANYFEQYNAGGYYASNLWIRPAKYYSEYTVPSVLYDRFRAVKERTYENIQAVHENFLAKVFAGEILHMDNEWKDYINEIYNAGLKEWTDIWNSKQIDTFDRYGQ
jgi:putative aldouronate transport system substrate-binding protein